MGPTRKADWYEIPGHTVGPDVIEDVLKYHQQSSTLMIDRAIRQVSTKSQTVESFKAAGMAFYGDGVSAQPTLLLQTIHRSLQDIRESAPKEWHGDLDAAIEAVGRLLK